jgi:hypothetical protein
MFGFLLLNLSHQALAANDLNRSLSKSTVNQNPLFILADDTTQTECPVGSNAYCVSPTAFCCGNESTGYYCAVNVNGCTR